MPDGSIGSIVSDALSMGVLAKGAAGAIAGEFAKGTLKLLIDEVKLWVDDDDYEKFSKNPSSPARKSIIAEAVDERSDDEKVKILSISKNLIDELESSNPIGIDIGRLSALKVELGEITVSEGVGVRIKEADIQGTFQVDKLNVGSNQGK